jgi:nucleoside-diphosphate-sugar epimerase
MLIPRLVSNIQNGIAISIQGDDGIKINPIHVLDAARAIQASLNLKGCHRINIAGPNTLSLREICNIIGTALKVSPIFEENTSTMPGNLIADIERMKEKLVAPMIPFNQGIFDLL